jgi:hypothetical protein
MTSIIDLEVTRSGNVMHILLNDDQGELTLRRLRPWHRLLARSRAARLDGELARGASPEASASLAARAMALTSMEFRRDLAASLRRILAAAGEPARPASAQAAQAAHAAHAPQAAYAAPRACRPLRVPVRASRISRSAPLLAGLASQLAGPGPVPVRGVALVSQLLADGAGPLYREASGDDLGAIIERAADALTL